MTIRLLPLLLLCAACSAPKEWVREYDGHLPGTAWKNHSVFLVRDGATGRPLADVTIRQHAENEVSEAGAWAELVGEIRTDEFGLASRRIADDAGDFNWAIDARGFAPENEYGARCTAELDLQRGDRHSGRIIGPTGAPVTGVEVGHKRGCSHAPFLRQTITYAEPGGEVVGRVLDFDGKPPSWGVRQSYSGPRTVMARVAPDGTFRLRGLSPGPHTLIVGAQDRVHKVMRVVLKRDETRLIPVELPLRTSE